jgi:hypothetical protein
MVRPQVVHGGENLQISRVAENILNKHSLTADGGGPRAWGLGSGLTTPTIKMVPDKKFQSPRTEKVLWHKLSTGKWI